MFQVFPNIMDSEWNPDNVGCLRQFKMEAHLNYPLKWVFKS